MGAKKIAAIQARIEDRVAELKKSGEWGDEGDVYGADPLAKQSLVTTMGMQLKACKPFETIDELALTYLLVLVTTITLSVYLVVLRDASTRPRSGTSTRTSMRTSSRTSFENSTHDGAF